MKDSIKLLDNFIKDTTHEINTPISIINTNIELVEESKLDKREEKILKRIKIASRTLETIYKDLKFTTLENGKGLNVEKFNLKDLINERVEYFSIIMESKKIKLNLDLKDSFMEADSKLIARVIDNLISNAIKYNRVNGEITLILRQSSLVIKDSGIGIKKENIDKLFARYSRFNNSEGGFGIGLNIVKQIIDLHKFKIKIDSEENKGTEVKIKW